MPVIRPIDATSAAEIELVAHRMRETLVEVLGEEQGNAMYSMDWLKNRVREHIDPAQSTAQIFLSLDDNDGHITGHTIVRLDYNEAGKKVGLFSTTYVEPESRKSGVATDLIIVGEKWMLDQGMDEFVTYTSDKNTKLIKLFKKQGYEITAISEKAQMVEISKSFRPSAKIS